jgi:hypothetical protein
MMMDWGVYSRADVYSRCAVTNSCIVRTVPTRALSAGVIGFNDLGLSLRRCMCLLDRMDIAVYADLIQDICSWRKGVDIGTNFFGV